MKRDLRVSEHKDYIAVDLVDDNGKISETPFYLTQKHDEIVHCYDEEEKRWVKTKISMTLGNMLDAEDIDYSSNWQGLKWEIEPNDLLNTKYIRFLN